MVSKDIIAANPQGKATIALLDDLTSFKAHNVKSKDVPEWLADYFTSLLVLSASFNFKPVISTPYYLYLDNHQWKLSLIEPQAWDNCPYLYFAQCTMHIDKSWSLQPVEKWEDNEKLVNTIAAMKKEFFDSLNSETPIIESLPYFAEHLPYYQRLAAFGLAHSLKDSLQLKLGTQASQILDGKSILRQAKGSKFLNLNTLQHSS